MPGIARLPPVITGFDPPSLGKDLPWKICFSHRIAVFCDRNSKSMSLHVMCERRIDLILNPRPSAQRSRITQRHSLKQTKCRSEEKIVKCTMTTRASERVPAVTSSMATAVFPSLSGNETMWRFQVANTALRTAPLRCCSGASRAAISTSQRTRCKPM